MTHQTAGRTHVNPPAEVSAEPPTRSKVMATLAALACAACCALPFLIAAGLLTGAGAALAQNLLLAVAGVLLAASGFLWWLHRHRRAAVAQASGCADGTCSC
jgi:hypothetical protein